MKTPTTFSTSDLRKAFNRAAKSASNFIRSKSGFEKLGIRRDGLIERLNGRTQVSMYVVFPMIIAAIAGLILLEVEFSKMGMTAILDNDASRGFIGLAPILMAVALSVALLFAGHVVFHGIQKENAVSGRREVDPKFYMGIVGFVIMAGFQFLVSKSVSGSDSSLQWMPYIVLGIAVIEFIVGGLFMEMAFIYAALAMTAILQLMHSRQMHKSASATHEQYTLYCDMVDASPGKLRVGNQKIQLALRYYNEVVNPADEDGIKLQLEQPTEAATNTRETEEEIVQPSGVAAQPRDAGNVESTTIEEVRKEFEEESAVEASGNEHPENNTIPPNNVDDNLTL